MKTYPCVVWEWLFLRFCSPPVQVLGGLIAGVAALVAPRANAVDIRDDTTVRERGFDLIYEARDLDLAQVLISPLQSQIA